MIKLSILLISLMFFLQSIEVEARIGVCGNRRLPRGKIRHLRNLRLECSSDVDHFIRKPYPMSKKYVNEWRGLERLSSGREKMQSFRQKEPLIEWEGEIPYRTVEKWSWEELVYGPDPVCGYDEITTTDSDGNTTTTRIMRSCWHDVTRYESRFCSSLVMKYKAHYERPSVKEWNPNTPGYYDVIPNKYDLLPGEMENVQIYSNNRMSKVLNPVVKIGDAWNKYKVNVKFTAGRVRCYYKDNPEIDVTIKTVKRYTNKQTPNTFRYPIDRHGRKTNPLSWIESPGNKGKYVRSEPTKVELMDVSDTIIATLAKQSRKYGKQIQAAKIEAGKLQSTTEESDVGFFKDTLVRARIIESIPWARDKQRASTLFTRGSNVAIGSRYKIDLHSNVAENSAYVVNGFVFSSINELFGRVHLRPGRKYELRVSMYQKGVPFYKQEGTFTLTSSYYSKELAIPFSATKDYDGRSLWQKFLDWQGDKW